MVLDETKDDGEKYRCLSGRLYQIVVTLNRQSSKRRERERERERERSSIYSKSYSFWDFDDDEVGG